MEGSKIKVKWPGIFFGILVFFTILVAINFLNSDFDAHLIQSVEKGVPAEDLIPEIDKETENLRLDAQKRLDSNVMNMKMWGNGNLVSEDDLTYYTQTYETEMKVISDYDKIRKKFAKREISKEEFLQEINNIKTSVG